MKQVEVFEIWGKAKKGEGQAIVIENGKFQERELLARIVGNEIIFLKEDYIIEKSVIDKEHE